MARELTFTEWCDGLLSVLARADEERMRLECKAADMRREAAQEGLGYLEHATLDQVNQMLRDGRATKANAELYVELWNTKWSRLTRAELKSRSVPFGDTGMTVHYIVLHDDP